MEKTFRYWPNKDEFYNILKKYALSNIEIEKCYEKGIINPNINNTILKEYEDGFQFYIKRTYPKIEQDSSTYRKDVYLKYWYSYLASLGIKMFFIEDDHFPEDSDNCCIYITDFHLIFSKKLEYIWNGLDKPKTYKKPEILIIPLDKIKKLELKSRGEVNYYSEGYSYIKEGSPELGAIMGGAIGGTTGAIVGALSNQTKVVNVPGYSRIYEKYSLIIEIGKEKVLEFETILIRENMAHPEYHKSITLEGNKKLSKININEPQYSKDPIKMINEKLNFLLSRAKKVSNDERSNITKLNIGQTMEFLKKEKVADDKADFWAKVITIIIFIALFIVCAAYSFSNL